MWVEYSVINIAFLRPPHLALVMELTNIEEIRGCGLANKYQYEMFLNFTAVPNYVSSRK